MTVSLDERRMRSQEGADVKVASCGGECESDFGADFTSLGVAKTRCANPPKG
jgi:hypothetical protein